jgi:polyketide cyclase/dehydrase/lipid transport protein
MSTFDVQSIEIAAPFERVFAYIADPATLPEWAHAFKAVSNGRATLATANGVVQIGLTVDASREQGTIDWMLAFPDGSEAKAFSRAIRARADCTVYSFVLLPPPGPLEQLEGAFAQQREILREELATLRRLVESR